MPKEPDAHPMQPNWEELGRQLEKARGSSKAAAVARALNFSGKQLRNYERAIPTNGRPGADRIVDLATYYGVDPQPWLDLVGYVVPRRVGGSLELGGGIRTRVSEGSDKVDPTGGTRRGEEELSDSERQVVREAAALLAKSAKLQEQVAAMLLTVGEGEPKPDEA